VPKTMCCNRKTSIPLPERAFWLEPPIPTGNSIVASYFPFKSWSFENPFPPGIRVNLPRCGYGYFLELHVGSFRI